MEKSRKRLRVCLICIVGLAILLGILYYYFGSKSGEILNDGTLISRAGTEILRLWR